MRRIWGGLLCLLLFSVPRAASAGQVSFTGTFINDDDVQLFSLTLNSGANVIMRTWSYGGGTNLAGTTIPGGGFDPTLTLFDNFGNWVAAATDGPAAYMNPDNGNYFDAYLSIALNAGQYTLALTQSDNGAAGRALTDGFFYSNLAMHDFTTSYCLTGSSAAGFCDSAGDLRTGAWAVDLDNVDAASGPTSVPEPATFVPAAGALALLLRRYSPKRRN